MDIGLQGKYMANIVSDPIYFDPIYFDLGLLICTLKYLNY